VGNTTKACDPGFSPQQQLGGEVAEGHDDLGSDQPNLLSQVTLARVDLLRSRVTIPRRSALEDIGYVDLRSLKPNLG
jgi:hypothetical protein